MNVYSHERGLRILKETTLFNAYKVKYPTAIKVTIPDFKQLNDWVNNGQCRTPDGCITEPDGDCPHGYPSWLKVLGYI